MPFTSRLRAFLTKPVNRIESIVITVLLVPLLAAAVTSAATTISTDISTGGSLSVTATTTLHGSLDIPTAGRTFHINAEEGNPGEGNMRFILGELDDNTSSNVLFGDDGTISMQGENWNATFGGSGAIDISDDFGGYHITDGTGNVLVRATDKLTLKGDNSVEINGDLTVTGTTNGVKVYRALLTQSGTNAPVATVLENSLGGEVVWTRTGEGYYLANLENAFPSDHTFVQGAVISHVDPSVATAWLNGVVDTDDDNIEFHTTRISYDGGFGSGEARDGLLQGNAVEILVYP